MKILLVDDHIVVREGVRRLLSGMQALPSSRPRPGKRRSLSSARRSRSGTAQLNLSASAGGSSSPAAAEDEKVRIVVFSMHAEPVYAARALRLGARG